MHQKLTCNLLQVCWIYWIKISNFLGKVLGQYFSFFISLEILRSYNGHLGGLHKTLSGYNTGFLRFKKESNSWFLSWPMFQNSYQVPQNNSLGIVYPFYLFKLLFDPLPSISPASPWTFKHPVGCLECTAISWPSAWPVILWCLGLAPGLGSHSKMVTYQSKTNNHHWARTHQPITAQ